MHPLRPAGELNYDATVARLFAELTHAGVLPVTSGVITVQVGDQTQGAAARWYVALSDAHIQSVRYQAFGCPHFLAACEWLARWLEGREIKQLSHWSWRDLEHQLQVPAAKRGRLLLLDSVVQRLAVTPSG